MKNSWEIYNDILHVCVWLPRWLNSKQFACQFSRHRRWAFNPWVWKIPWRRKCNPLQYSCLENPMDRGAWQATVHGVAKSRTWLSDWSCTHASVCMCVHGYNCTYIYICICIYVYTYAIFIHTHVYYIYTYKICIFYFNRYILYRYSIYVYNTENLVFFLPSISFLSMYMQVIFSLKGKVCPSNSLNLS